MKLLTLIFLLACSLNLKAQQQPQQPAQTPADDKQMKAWMAYMTPGKPHEMMAKSVGEWKAEVTQWMDPSQPPMKSQATVRNEMMMDGRYLATHYKGTFMNMPFHGMGVMAYDNASKKYSSSWIDNMGTGLMYLTGTMREDGKSIELKGSYIDPVTGKEEKMREVMTFIDDNHQKLEMWGTMNGKEMKMMELTLSR